MVDLQSPRQKECLCVPGLPFLVSPLKKGSPLLEMAALADYENWLLERYSGRVPQGLERLTDPQWTAHVRADLPHSDFTWEQYAAYVEAGGGDEWFHMEASAASPATLPNLLDSASEDP